jgi:quercetin dioxygenase-like cupin family protein
MLEVRHEPTAPTRTLRLASGDKIDAHRHDDHQIVYAGRGVLAVTTDQGSWVAPATRAIWIPAGTFHAHRAYGELKLHTVGLSTATQLANRAGGRTLVARADHRVHRQRRRHS